MAVRPGAGAARRRGRQRAERSAGEQSGRLRLVRRSDDQLTVAWKRRAGVAGWRVVCWDAGDRPVAHLSLPSTFAIATFRGLAHLRQPFTIGVSALADDGQVVWQDGLAELCLGEREGGAADGRSVSPRRRERRPRAPARRGEQASTRRLATEPPASEPPASGRRPPEGRRGAGN
jgi:hypothetical protein